MFFTNIGFRSWILNKMSDFISVYCYLLMFDLSKVLCCLFVIDLSSVPLTVVFNSSSVLLCSCNYFTAQSLVLFSVHDLYFSGWECFSVPLFHWWHLSSALFSSISGRYDLEMYDLLYIIQIKKTGSLIRNVWYLMMSL